MPGTITAYMIALSLMGPTPWGKPSVIVDPFISPDYAAYVTLNDKYIRVDGKYWNTLSAWQRCTVYLHEYGHMTGHVHSPDKRSFMHDDTAETVFWACRVVGRPVAKKPRWLRTS